MQEDKLTHSERLRLECIAQAIAAGYTSHDQIVGEAKKYEEYLTEGSKMDLEEGLRPTMSNEVLKIMQSVTGDNNDIAHDMFVKMLKEGIIFRRKI